MIYGYGTKLTELQKACNTVEQELRKLEASNIKIYYSEGIVISGLKGDSSSADLFNSIMKLKGK